MIKSTFIFSLGVAAGVAASYLYWKNHYERWAQEQVNTMREHYNEKKAPEEEMKPEPEETEVEVIDIQQQEGKGLVPEMMEYAKKVASTGYTNYADRNQGDEDMCEKPYAISPDEFGENLDYSCVTLTYRPDGVLVDEMDDPIEDVNDFVGEDFARYFGKYEDDVAYVRNDRLKCDCEILRELDY